MSGDVTDLVLERDQVGEAFDAAVESGAPVEVLDVLMGQIRVLSARIADAVA